MSRHQPPPSLRSAPPRQPLPDDPDDLSASTQAHDAHFLERTLRCESPDLDRAMRLYHHSEVVRRLMPDLMAFFPQQERAAVPLRDAPPTPHAILTREGHFVTCLAPGMAVRDLPVLPYRRFAEAMDQADARLAQDQVRKRQLAELPPDRLALALVNGPGHVTREMAEVVLLAPTTYETPVAAAYYRSIALLTRIWKLTARANRSPRRVEILMARTAGTARLALYLLGQIHTPFVLNLLCAMAPYETTLEAEILAAISRHPDGADRLFALLDHPQVAERPRKFAGAALLNHCILQPGRAHQTAQRFHHLPLAHDGWEVARVMMDTFLKVPPQILVEKLGGMVAVEKEPFTPRAACWLLSEMELMTEEGQARRVSEYFPPEAIAAQVRVAWDQRVRSAEDWGGQEHNIKTVVRQGARVGRNDPCPCGSGRKHKLCCQGKLQGPAAPDPAEIARRKMEEREEFVRQVQSRSEDKKESPAAPE